MSTEEVIKRLSPDKFFLKAFRFSLPRIISTIGQLELLEMLMVDLTIYVLGSERLRRRSHVYTPIITAAHIQH